MSVMRTRPGGRAEGRARFKIAAKYHEVAELAATETGDALNNVVVGIAVLAGIAAADALCLVSLGKSYAGTDHAEAARLLEEVDARLAKELAKLVRLKPPAHYGYSFLSDTDRTVALRSAEKLLAAARMAI